MKDTLHFANEFYSFLPLLWLRNYEVIMKSHFSTLSDHWDGPEKLQSLLYSLNISSQWLRQLRVDCIPVKVFFFAGNLWMKHDNNNSNNKKEENNFKAKK